MASRLIHQFLLRIGVIGATAGFPVGAAANDNGDSLATGGLARSIAHQWMHLERDSGAMLEKLAAAGHPRIDHALPAFLASLLDRATTFERIELVCDWTMRPEVELRRAIAAAVAECRDAVGLRAAIEHLAADDDAGVRRAAAKAAWAHQGEDPSRYMAILEELATDPDGQVREVATAALRG